MNDNRCNFVHQGLANVRRSWKPLLIGQVLALLLAASGIAVGSLKFNCNLSAPTMQAGLLYFMLSFHLLFIPRININTGNDRSLSLSSPSRSEGETRSLEVESIPESEPEPESSMDRSLHVLLNCIPIDGSFKVYFIMAFLDVEANYLTFLAYRYTSLTSVSLLDALAIPSAMVFSRILLRRLYRLPHLIGAVICILGVVVNVLGDSSASTSTSSSADVDVDDVNIGDDDEIMNDDALSSHYPYLIRGDILAIAGAIIYGLNDVLTERIVKKMGSVNEYLGMIGFFGCIICFFQALLIERDAMANFFGGGSNHEDDDDDSMGGKTCPTYEGLLLLGGSIILGVVSYTGMSIFLIHSEAALLNLSLLTGDLWAAAFTVLVQQILPSSNFWIALFLIVTGVSIYECSPSPAHNDFDGHHDIISNDAAAEDLQQGSYYPSNYDDDDDDDDDDDRLEDRSGYASTDMNMSIKVKEII